MCVYSLLSEVGDYKDFVAYSRQIFAYVRQKVVVLLAHLWSTKAMNRKDLKDYFGSVREAAAAIEKHPSHIYRMGDPLKLPWSAVFEVMSGGKLKANIDKYKK